MKTQNLSSKEQLYTKMQTRKRTVLDHIVKQPTAAVMSKLKVNIAYIIASRKEELQKSTI